MKQNGNFALNVSKIMVGAEKRERANGLWYKINYSIQNGSESIVYSTKCGKAFNYGSHFNFQSH